MKYMVNQERFFKCKRQKHTSGKRHSLLSSPLCRSGEIKYFILAKIEF